MMAEGFFGGFAQGLAGGMERRRLRDVMQLQERQFEADQQFRERQQSTQERQFEQQLELQRRQVETQEAESQFRMKVEDFNISKGMFEMLKGTTKPGMRKYILQQLAPRLGIDRNTQQYKDFEKLLSSLDPEESQQISELLAAAGPNAQPGQIKAFAQAVVSGQLSITDALEALREISKQSRVGQIIGGTGAPQGQPQRQFNPLNPTSIIDQEAPLSGGVPAGAAPVQTQQVGPQAGSESPAEMRRRAMQLGAEGFLEEARLLFQAAKDIEGNPLVKIDTAGETKESEELGKLNVERAKEMFQAGEQAQNINVQLKNLRTTLESGQFETGAFAGTRMFAGQVGRLLGIDTKLIPGVGAPETAEAIQTFSNRAALELAEELSRLTNLGLTFVTEAVPNLVKTPEGNLIIIEMMENINNRRIKLANFAEDFITKHGTTRPKGKRSLFQEIALMRETEPVLGEDLQKRIKAVSAKNKSINLEDLARGVSEVELPSGEKQRQLKIGSKTYPVLGMENGIQQVEIMREGKKTKVPVVWDEEQRSKLGADQPFIWGPDGNLYGPKKAQ